MLRGLRLAILALVVLALGAAEAHAATYNFTLSPDPPNEDQVTTFRFQGSMAEIEDEDDIRWDLDNDGRFNDGEGTVVTRTFANRGPVTVRMRVHEEDGPRPVTSKSFTVNGAPAVNFSFSPQSPLEGEGVTFSPTGTTDPEGDGLTYRWDFGDGEAATGPTPTHAFDDDGTYDVVLTATDEHGAFARKTGSVQVARDPGPTAAFVYRPEEPLTDELITFTSTSTASQGALTAHDWDLDGDGAFDDASGAEVTWSYATAGTHEVALRTTQANGRSSIAFGDVDVRQRPPAESPPPDDTSEVGGNAITDPVVTPVIPLERRSTRLLRMRPFPVVRIAGVVLPNGALINILSVRVGRGAQVRIRCRGRACPVGSVARTSATRLLRFRKFERRLAAGTRLTLFIRQRGRIGKYTRFLIRAGKPPARVDRCLIPGRARPTSCP